MEKLQTKLFEAATQNSIASLHQLLKHDPLLLDRAFLNPFNETPLHVASMLGHLEFVQEIIGLKPELVNELNSQLSSPLHLAAAKGHVGVVKALLSVDNRACLERDRNEVLPLHLAAAKGHVEAMKVLLEAEPDAAMVKSYGGESILHLCVKSYQLEALRLIVERVRSDELINSRDDDGNTLLHLAVAEKQVEAIKFLVSAGGVEVNTVNHEGLTALDVLIRSRRDLRDSEIEKSLKNVGGFATLENNNDNPNNPNPLHKKQELGAANSSSKKKRWWSLFKQHDENFEKLASSLMVVAVLIATVAFQVAANPPGGVWQEDKEEIKAPDGTILEPRKVSGDSVFAYNYPEDYEVFFVLNTVAFMVSLSIILVLVSGLRMVARRFFTWIIMVMTWIAITAIAWCYLGVLVVLTPVDNSSQIAILNVIDTATYVWIGLMGLLLFGHTILILWKLVKKVKNAWKSWRSKPAGPGPGPGPARP